MVWKQILSAREHSRESFLESFKSKPEEIKLTVNIKCCLDFQNILNSLQILHIPWTPNQAHEKVFRDSPAFDFRKNHLAKAKFPNVFKKIGRTYGYMDKGIHVSHMDKGSIRPVMWYGNFFYQTQWRNV